MASVSSPGYFQSCCPITCSTLDSAARARVRLRRMGYIRRNHLVPIPSFESFDALNAYLEEQCTKRLDVRLKGRTETVGEMLERERQTFLALPQAPYDASDKQMCRVSSLSLVRYKSNDYSVPVEYGHREVLVRGYVHEVVVSCADKVIARHRRSYDKGDFVFDPLHYLSLIERKVGALDQAAPLAGWELNLRPPAPHAGALPNCA